MFLQHKHGVRLREWYQRLSPGKRIMLVGALMIMGIIILSNIHVILAASASIAGVVYTASMAINAVTSARRNVQTGWLNNPPLDPGPSSDPPA